MNVWFKRFVVSAALLAVASVGEAHSGAYRVGRLTTPYSSFNISGINYGSQQWNKQHAKSAPAKSTAPRWHWRWRR